MTNGKGP